MVNTSTKNTNTCIPAETFILVPLFKDSTFSIPGMKKEKVQKIVKS
jgi:hypothetical protein